MKFLLVAGARPNFIKIASLINAIDAFNQTANEKIEHILVHTGQHYDKKMSDSFFHDLELPQPDINLEVGSGSHAEQTAEIMKRFEQVLLDKQPEVVMVVGDVNSTIACSLVASKIVFPNPMQHHGLRRPLIVHVEAGLRSFDRDMPEEVNRVLTDVISDMLFVTEPSGEINLRNEGIASDKVFHVGNTMVDTLLKHRDKANQSDILQRLGLGKVGDTRPYIVVTLHRPSNVDNADMFRVITEALDEATSDIPALFPVHPRTQARIKEFGLDDHFVFSSEVAEHGITCLEPLGYLDFLCLVANARLAVTDSGGIQEETTALGVPCVTLRLSTERPVTVDEGTNVMSPLDKDSIVKLVRQQLESPKDASIPKYWDGNAGKRIIDTLVKKLNG